MNMKNIPEDKKIELRELLSDDGEGDDAAE